MLPAGSGTRLQAREYAAPAPPAAVGNVHQSRRADAVATLNLGDSEITIPTSCALLSTRTLVPFTSHTCTFVRRFDLA